MRITQVPEQSAQSYLHSYQSPTSAEISTVSTESTTLHTVEPELLGQTPRSVQWTLGTAKIRRGLWNAMAGTLCFLLFFARKDLANWDALVQRGVVVQGEIIKIHTPRTRESKPYIQFTVPVDGAGGTERESISWKELDSFSLGQSVPITYVPETYGKVWKRGVVTVDGRDKSLRRWIILGGLLFGVYGIALVSFETSWRRQHRLLRTGKIAQAQIESITLQMEDDVPHYLLRYQFTTPKPVSFQSIFRGMLFRRIDEYEESGGISAPMTVLYDAENPGDHIVYSRLTAAKLLG